MPHQRQGREFTRLYSRLSLTDRAQLVMLEAYLYTKRRAGSLSLFGPSARPDRIAVLHTVSLTVALIAFPPFDVLSIITAWVLSLLLTTSLDRIAPGR